MRRLAIGLSAFSIPCLLVATAAAQVAPTEPAPADPAAAPAPPPPSAPAPAPLPAATLTAAPEAPLAQNAIYVELAGAGGFYSVNYERFLRKDVSIRGGLMYMSMSATASSGGSGSSASATWISVPVMAQYLGLSAGAHALELAGGLSIMYMSGAVSTFDATSDTSAMGGITTPVGTAAIGYRYSDPSGGFVFRAGYTPLIFFTTQTKDVFHWGGMSFGYRFK